MTLPRVSPPTIFPQATRASKPPDDAAGSADAYRQTTFVLNDEVEAVLEGLRLEAAIAEASSGSKFRNQTTAAILSYWSRSWLDRLQVLHSLEWGNYGVGLSLLMVGAEHAAGTVGMVRSDASTWREWLEAGGIHLSPEERATVFEPSEFSFQDAVGHHPPLVQMIFALTMLTGPDPATTALLTAADSDAERTAVTFGDRDFHLALAEIGLGMLLRLSAIHLELAGPENSEGRIAPAPDKVAGWASWKDKLLARPDRCAIQLRSTEDDIGLTITNWRRRPGNAPRKLLL